MAARQSDYWANYHDTRFSCLAGLLLIPTNDDAEEKTAVDAIKKRDLLNWNIGEFQLIESATEGIILCRVIKNGFLIRWWECGRSTVGLKTLALKC